MEDPFVSTAAVQTQEQRRTSAFLMFIISCRVEVKKGPCSGVLPDAPEALITLHYSS